MGIHSSLKQARSCTLYITSTKKMKVIILCALLAVACAAKGGNKGKENGKAMKKLGKQACKMVNTHVEGFNKCSAAFCKAGADCYEKHEKKGDKLSCSKDGVAKGMKCVLRAVKKSGACPVAALKEMKKHGMMGAKC